ncbi:MAG: CBS domain-containing protein [Candidatus Yanofskybacteria bacterium]|nr:CBS domain-containing protein [Candidatus Yanofskybacteria bacterium]
MIKEAKLGEFVTGTKNESLDSLAKKMQASGLRNIYIIDEKKKPIGVVSILDFNNKIIAQNKNPKGIKAEEVMESPVWTIDANESVRDAYYKMIELNRFAIPIIEKGKIIGILSLNEALRLMVEKKRQENAGGNK